MNTIEQQIADISAQQKADAWAARQESARQQQVDAERQRAERHRTNRIAQLQAQLKQIPTRLKQADAQAAEADSLASVWASDVDDLAANYAKSLHAARHSARSASLELGSPESLAYFFGGQIKESLRELALTANSQSFGAPVIDAESLAAELRNEEKKLKAELSELEMRG